MIETINKCDSIVSSHFFEKKYSEKSHLIFKDLLWCIVNRKKILINQITLDTASNSQDKNQNINFKPLKLIYHKGSIFIGGISEKKKVLLFDLEQLDDYKHLNSIYKNQAALIDYFDYEISKRFGISENKDNEIYNIEIEISKETGNYIRNFKWHHTQSFRKTADGFILNLKCGINIELVTWILMWLTDVRIIKPNKLKELYIRQLISCTELYSSNKAIIHSNIFLK